MSKGTTSIINFKCHAKFNFHSRTHRVAIHVKTYNYKTMCLLSMNRVTAVDQSSVTSPRTPIRLVYCLRVLWAGAWAAQRPRILESTQIYPTTVTGWTRIPMAKSFACNTDTLCTCFIKSQQPVCFPKKPPLEYTANKCSCLKWFNV